MMFCLPGGIFVWKDGTEGWASFTYEAQLQTTGFSLPFYLCVQSPGCAKCRLCKVQTVQSPGCAKHQSWTSLRTAVPTPSSWYQYWFSVSSTIEWCQIYDWSKFLLPRRLGITFLFYVMWSITVQTFRTILKKADILVYAHNPELGRLRLENFKLGLSGVNLVSPLIHEGTVLK